MNYDETAKKLLDDVCRYLQCDHCSHVGSWRETRRETCPNNAVNVIAAALRRAANEAAWDAYVLGHGCASMACAGDPEASDMFAEKMVAKYGPRPEGGTR